MAKEFNPAEYGAVEIKKSFNPEDYGATEIKQAPSGKDYLNKAEKAADQIVLSGGDFTQGLIQGGANLPIDIINLANKFAQMGNKGQFIPGHDYPQIPRFDNAPHNLSSEAGQVGAGFIAPQAEAPQIAETLSSNLSSLGQKVAAPFEKIQPEKLAKQILNNRGQGIDSNALYGAEQLGNKAKEKIAQSTANYAPILEKVGQDNIYDNGKFSSFYHGTNNKDDILNEGLTSHKYSFDHPTLTDSKSTAEAYSTRINGGDEPADIIEIKIPKDKINEYLHKENNNWAIKSNMPKGTDETKIFGIKKSIPREYIFNNQKSSGIEKSLEIPKELKSRHLGPDIEDAIGKFNESPTFEKAHSLQSALATQSARLNKSNNPLLENVGKRINNFRKTLVDQMKDYLKSKGDNLAEDYQGATDFHRDNVIPYTSTPIIDKIIRGERFKPKEVFTPFKESHEHVDKMISDLGDEFKNNILYSKFGKYSSSSSPKSLLDEMNRIDESGYSAYKTKQFNDMKQELAKRIAALNTVKKIGKVAGVGGLATGAGGGLSYLWNRR